MRALTALTFAGFAAFAVFGDASVEVVGDDDGHKSFFPLLLFLFPSSVDGNENCHVKKRHHENGAHVEPIAHCVVPTAQIKSYENGVW